MSDFNTRAMIIESVRQVSVQLFDATRTVTTVFSMTRRERRQAEYV